MGSACCVAAKDRTVSIGTSSEILQRNVRYSPSWSFRWDNRGRVAGEEISVSSFSRGVSSNATLDIKSQTTSEIAYASEEGSPLDCFESLTWQKYAVSEGHAGALKLPQGDHPSVSTSCMEATGSIGSPEVPVLSPTKTSPSIHPVSSISTSPLSSQSHPFHPSSAPPRWARRSPGHKHFRQVSDSRISGFRSPKFSISEEGPTFGVEGWSNESFGHSQEGSSDGGSTPSFSDLMTRGNWSFDNETRDRISRLSVRISSSPSFDIRSCAVCSKNLNELSVWGRKKMSATNEIAVVAILICGHAYHAECLENLTPESSKFDPSCPVCTLGEKQSIILYEKALRGELDLKVKISKRSRKRIGGVSLGFWRQKSESIGIKMTSSSSTKSSSVAKPFLRQHFSFGSKGSSKSLSNCPSTKKKGFFWSKSSKE